jgi:riboflavin kinase/FMN adenylyltransferase
VTVAWNKAAMIVHRDLRQLPPGARGCAVAIGNFDGVHRGHRAVIEAARRLTAGARPVAVLTFEPHPKEVVSPATAPLRLTPTRRKIELLRELGCAHLFLLRFDQALMAMPAEAFVETILVQSLDIRALTSGDSFRFGHKRQGDAALLAAAGARHGFDYAAISPLLDDGAACSSTRIRAALRDGDIATANRLLGYAFTYSGLVQSGDRRGRTIGFPTANLLPATDRHALPANGVYAVRARRRTAAGTCWHPGVANLGRRPTFGGDRTLLEVHLFDAELDLYGQRLNVAFVERLRGETSFSGIDALKAQIARDCEDARRVLGLVAS